MLDLLLSERSSTLSFSGRQKSFRNAWIFLFTNTVPSFFLFYDLSCLSNQWGCCLIVFLDAANNTAFRVIPLWVYWGWYNMFTSNNKHNTFYFFLGILQSTRMCAVLEFLVAAHILTSNVDSMCCKHMSKPLRYACMSPYQYIHLGANNSRQTWSWHEDCPHEDNEYLLSPVWWWRCRLKSQRTCDKFCPVKCLCLSPVQCDELVMGTEGSSRNVSSPFLFLLHMETALSPLSGNTRPRFGLISSGISTRQLCRYLAWLLRQNNISKTD